MDTGVRVVFTDRCDQPSDVAEALGSAAAPVRVKQVHGTQVVNGSDEALAGSLVEADGIFLPAGSPQVGAIATADCLPLVVANGNGDAVVVHVGWRGLAAGIVEAGIAKLGGHRLVAVIGPHIRSCCYQFLGPERYVVARRFGQSCFVGDNLSLETALGGLLSQQRVHQVHSVDRCTSCHSAYHSYRRDHTTQRQYTLVTTSAR